MNISLLREKQENKAESIYSVYKTVSAKTLTQQASFWAWSRIRN